MYIVPESRINRVENVFGIWIYKHIRTHPIRDQNGLTRLRNKGLRTEPTLPHLRS